MNLLFFKNKKNSLIIIIFSLLFYSFNSSFKNNNEDPFLKICKNSDAYYLYSNTDVFYTKRWINYKRLVTVNNKLVVNNANGVDKFAFLKLSEYESNNIKKIKIRTLKSDGSIIELDSNLVFKKDSKSKKISAINYPIPAVEPGDTIETSYTYSEILEKGELMDYVSLQLNSPSKKINYTIKTGSELAIRYKQYNNFPDPEVVTNDTLVQIKFSVKNLKGLTENEHNCTLCELPYLYYTLENKKSTVRNWNDVYNQEFNFLTQPISIDHHRSTYYKRWKRRIIDQAKDSSKYYKFKLLYNEVLNNFKMVDINREELIKASGYFLKEKKFNPISLRRFYRQILEDLEIEYWAVFGRSRLLGTIDVDYVRKGEFDHIFFAYENKDGFAKFLYPHEDIYKYQIDELPTRLYNTKAVLVKPIFREKKSKKVKFITRNLTFAKTDTVNISAIKLPGMDPNFNYINQIISGQVNIKEKKTTLKYMFKASGGLYTELRSFYSMLNKNEEASNFYDALSKFEGNENAIQIDSLTSITIKTKKPFSYSTKGLGKLNNSILFLNDSLVSISIDKLIKHSQIESKTESIDLNYYLDYSYSDNFTFYLNFPSKIKILGLENGNINFKNDYGEYLFEVKQSKENQIKFRSNYIIKKEILPKEKYNDLKQLNEQVKNVKNKRLIVKLIS
ncbi:DUF3857 domain-containing protein [Polaribacter sp. Z022]|nr:DUF3857 domain-containing protein [Polaribacter sp. Z022]